MAHGPGVQGVAHHPPGQLGNAGDPGHRRHRPPPRGRIHRPGCAAAPPVPGHDAAQVGGVCPLGDGGDSRSCPGPRRRPRWAGRQHAAPGAHCVQSGQVKPPGPAPRTGGKGACSIMKLQGASSLPAGSEGWFFSAKGLLPLKHGDFGGGRPWVDHKDAIFHTHMPPSGPEMLPHCTAAASGRGSPGPDSSGSTIRRWPGAECTSSGASQRKVSKVCWSPDSSAASSSSRPLLPQALQAGVHHRRRRPAPRRRPKAPCCPARTEIPPGQVHFVVIWDGL